MHPSKHAETKPPAPVREGFTQHDKYRYLSKVSFIPWIRDHRRMIFFGDNRVRFDAFLKTLEYIYTQTEVGCNLIKTIDKVSRTRRKILYIDLESDKITVTPIKFDDAGNFRGTDCLLRCNFNAAAAFKAPDMVQETFNASILFHELVHVYHMFNGERIIVKGTQSSHNHKFNRIIEEARTTGLGSFATEIFSENQFRRELGLPLRKFYQTDPTGINGVHDDNTLTIDGVRRPLHPLLKRL